MNLLARQDFYSQLRSHLAALIPRPHTGALWKDIAFLLVIVFLQTTVIPRILIDEVQFDLLTPWLVILSIRQQWPSATLLAVLAALSLETRSSAPAGLYLCIYWIMVNIIIQVRAALSWRHQVPWLITYLLASLWVNLFETFVIFLSNGNSHMTWSYWVTIGCRIVSAVTFGMILCREWHSIDAEEPVPE